MWRLVLFFVTTILLARLLGSLPLVGPLFARTGILGIWIVAIALGVGLTHWGERMVRWKRSAAELRRLVTVGGPVNHGKAGLLLLAGGRPRRAAEHLALAAEGEPDKAEWHYRHGCALLTLRRTEEALAALRQAVEIDEEYAYGAAQLRLAEALARRGDHESALGALQRFERNHGPSPESTYRRARALRALGRRTEARAAFSEVGRLARHAARYQKREALAWSTRAAFARWL